uniref:VWFA domain-containing protein n=1 Tax=Steinernema glaseri TaxID=37863 RepID=A0A1I8ASB3_9BILA
MQRDIVCARLRIVLGHQTSVHTPSGDVRPSPTPPLRLRRRHSLAAMILLRLLPALLGVFAIGAQPDFADNDLAKVCRPIDRQLDLLFILDGSGSVSGSTFDTQMQMLSRIVDMVEIGPQKTQIAVMQYSSYTRIEFGFSANQNKESIRAALQRIRHISGTTKTGKALDKALHLFQTPSSGARKKESVAQVAVVVTDGHSHDDPVPSALRLRQAGVQVLALGIGAHINVGELVQVTGDEQLAFQNLTTQDSLNQFTDQFRRIAIGEHCDFAKGTNGAEITCLGDSVSIDISTVKRFHGHLYVKDHFHDPACVVQTASSDVHMRLRLVDCDIQKQFMLNPRGILFETNVILQFHPHYATHKDKMFHVKCFYPDKKFRSKKPLPAPVIEDRSEASAHSDKDFFPEGEDMPCTYRISRRAEQCSVEDVIVGDPIVHRWECRRDMFDTYQSMLVHSCVLIDLATGSNRTVIDASGCSTDPSIIETPDYVDPLNAFSSATTVRYPDSPLVRLKCKLRFCDRLMGQCNDLLPPKCRHRRHTQMDFAGLREFFGSAARRRHAGSGFPVGIRAFAGGDEDYDRDDVPSLVTFNPQRPEGHRVRPPRLRRPIDQRVMARVGATATASEVGSVAHSIVTTERALMDLETAATVTTSSATSTTTLSPLRTAIRNFPQGGMDLRLNTQDVAIVSSERLKNRLEKAIKVRVKDIEKGTRQQPSKPVDISFQQTQTDPFLDVPEAIQQLKSFRDSETTVSFKAETEEPEEPLWTQIDLDPQVMAAVSVEEIELESQILNVHDGMPTRERQRGWCHKLS